MCINKSRYDTCTLTMYQDGHICFSKVSKRCSISEISSNEGSDIKGVQFCLYSRGHGDDSRSMSNGEVVGVETMEPKVVSPRFDQLRVFHFESYFGHLCSAVCWAGKIFCPVVTLYEVNVRFWCG